MKKTLVLLATILGLSSPLQAQVPPATYWWNFNQTNVNSTNYIFPTVTGGTVPAPSATLDGVLRELDGVGNSVNLLGLLGSGVSSGTFTNIPYDRALLVPGVYGGTVGSDIANYIVRTPDDAHALTNWPNGGIITKFTVTCWAKSEGSQGAFPRIVMFGANGQDAGSAGMNAFGLLFFNNGDLQLKIHNAGNPADSSNGMHTSGQPLSGAATNWVFIAVSCDMTLPTGGTVTSGTNTIFYFGDRVNSLTSQPLAPGDTIIYTNYIATTVNSGLHGSSADGPGYVDFSAAGVPLPYVAIANRYNGTSPTAGGGNRAFDGRYDDIRIFANQVLTLAQIEAVRTNAPPGLNGPLQPVQQPANTTVAEGQGASFSFVTTPAANETYQWYVIPHGSGTVSNAIFGATRSYLNTAPLTVAGNNGDKYMVIAHSTDPLSDNGGAGLHSSNATATVLSPSAYVPMPGALKFEYFANNVPGGTTVAGFLAAPTAGYTNNAPDLTLFMPSFDTRTVFPDNSHNNYFARITGWITPTVTTNYVFSLRASDQAQLLLSTDGGLTTNQIAVDYHSGYEVFYGLETAGATLGQQYSSPIPLVAGTSYPVVAYLKSSSGQNALQVAWRMDDGIGDLPTSDQSLSDRLQPILASALSTMALPLNTVSITQQPTASPSSTVVANSKITFNVGVSSTGTGPVVVQWRKNGVNISGATGTSYTTPYLGVADSGASFNAVVSAPGASNNTTPVLVTVNSDNVAPAVVGAASDDSMTAVTVQFSEPVNPATALNRDHYTINGGALAVTGVQWAAAANTNLVDAPVYDAVTLSTALQADNTAYKVTVTGVQDTAGHPIGGGNTAQFNSYGFAPGFGKFEYFEDLTYNAFYQPLDTADVSGMVNYSPKFINNDPDTIVYPKYLAMSPEGQATFRNGAFPITDFPPGQFGTRMKTIITPTNTGNYVFYLAADDTALLWLSTNANPANKHLIAAALAATGNSTEWTGGSSANSAQYNTNDLMSLVTLTNGSPWPFVDGSGMPVITLTAGQRYYLEVDHRETSGYGSFVAVNSDNGTGVPPAYGSASILVGNVIGWHFPQPAINSFAKVGNNVTISWTNAFGRINLGAVPWPGIIAPDTAPSIAPSFPNPALQSTLSLNPASWTTLTNTSPATIPATNPAQFFRVGDQ
jgi:hypothetical protein